MWASRSRDSNTRRVTPLNLSHIRALTAALLAALACAPAWAVTPQTLARADARSMEVWVDSVMAQMTLDQKIGQLMMIEAENSGSKASLSALTKSVEEYGVGGLLFRKGDIAAQARVTNAAQAAAKVQLLIAADAEWGLSMRLVDAPEFPRNMTLGAIGDDRLLYRYGREMARQCRLLGVNVNFAPVLDVVDDERNTAVGTRSLGARPERVAQLGVAFARGLEDNGVLAVAKHFPGHGYTLQDSHTTLPTVDKTLTGLNLSDLVPFKAYVEAGLSGMMNAHLNVPAVDSQCGASSLSAACVTGLLRGELGFEGLAFTDALVMQGAHTSGSSCVAALLAGNDVLLSPPNLRREIAAVRQAVENGSLSEALIDERCAKVLRYKYALGLNLPQSVDEKDLAERICSTEAELTRRELLAGAITALKSDGDILPIKHLEKNRIAVVTMGENAAPDDIFQQRCAAYSATRRFCLNHGEPLSKIISQLADYDVVIAAALTDNAACRSALEQIAANHPGVVAVICAKPFRLKNYSSAIQAAKGVVLTYDTCQWSVDAAAQTIFGGNAAAGRLPVNVAGVERAGQGEDYPATRLGYTIPQEVGLSPALSHKIDSIARCCIKKGAFPGCQVLVARRGKVVCDRCYGVTDPTSKTPVTAATVYDLASVSKALGTLPAIMALYDKGLIALNDKASKYIPQLRGGDKEDITIEQLLYHESGMPASLNMYDVMIDTCGLGGKLFSSRRSETHTIKVTPRLYAHRKARLRSDITSAQASEKEPVAVCDGIYCGRAAYDTIMGRIYAAKMRSSRAFHYSCLNFCLLMNIEENVTGTAHDTFTHNGFYGPLGAYTTTYRPAEKLPLEQIAPTERDPLLRRQTVRGYVHDELAAFSGGVQGNAGLFSCANDLAKICQMWLNGGVYGGERFLQESTVTTFCAAKSKNSHRGLGFDKPNMTDAKASSTCAEASAATFGHLGFTGTAFWVDPDNDLIFIFLCNRVHPTRTNPAFAAENPRQKIFSAVYQSIEK